MLYVYSVQSAEAEPLQTETLARSEKDFAAQVDTLPSSFQRKDAFFYELQNVMKESKDNVERLTQISDSENTEEIVSIGHSIRDVAKSLVLRGGGR